MQNIVAPYADTLKSKIKALTKFSKWKSGREDEELVRRLWEEKMSCLANLDGDSINEDEVKFPEDEGDLPRSTEYFSKPLRKPSKGVPSPLMRSSLAPSAIVNDDDSD